MTKTLLVTGAQGQLGSELRLLSPKHPDLSCTFIGRDDIDLSQPEAIQAYFKDKTFDVIINCAAYTAVDKAESEPALAKSINADAVEVLASIAKEKNSAIIHISTDYVFDGKNYRPYLETDKNDPQSVYGQTKLEGEQALQNINPPKSLIIRTSWVYSSFGTNFVKTMLRLGKERESLGVIFDQVGTPTYARDLAHAILTLVENPQLYALTATEIVHYSNEGVCSWYDFAKTLFELSGQTCQVNPIETKDYPTPATRPHYTLLNKTKIKQQFGISIPYWKESLAECLSLL
ncbi:dTDP-4-dehydrorhamnose reductase [Methylicorpusculum sp.]|uniref:dTDP-4-dehydrorhamnose reductase n=1 Tax=Methylicorpusculum sp. TaxID=2713644 RepID=UPI00272FD8F3|nr:dTDP-4-dehydrorhamnose reductase [Methylicorpusculum sp.]MDP2180800.1 dTDP-4-dehydrorhamnose reductase [Methylicorpusculum sp.]MDP3529964.1 dTDP-4-dehydrorhamnose reductase [Methylicorpusculum sp.]MDZ4151097.1 dTDP-4-dehydrorhamnose reductase [Methylicorpusculum sp.]